MIKFKNSKLILVVITFLTFVLVICVIYFLFQPLRIKGNSMQPTYNDGQLVFMDTITDTYNKNDVIVFYYGKEKVIKRIIATNGDKVDINANGVFINDIFITDNSQLFESNSYFLLNDEYFVMGDNYNQSLDSRFFGVISKNKIIGKVR